MADGSYLIQCLSVTKSRRIKLTAPDLTEALKRARQYFAAKYMEYVVVKLLASSLSSYIHVKLVDFVVQGYPQRYDCSNEEEAEVIRIEVLREIRKRGFEGHFDAWVFKKSVHVFPVYYEMQGSLNYIDRTSRKVLGGGRFNH